MSAESRRAFARAYPQAAAKVPAIVDAMPAFTSEELARLAVLLHPEGVSAAALAKLRAAPPPGEEAQAG